MIDELNNCEDNSVKAVDMRKKMKALGDAGVSLKNYVNTIFNKIRNDESAYFMQSVIEELRNAGVDLGGHVNKIFNKLKNNQCASGMEILIKELIAAGIKLTAEHVNKISEKLDKCDASDPEFNNSAFEKAKLAAMLKKHNKSLELPGDLLDCFDESSIRDKWFQDQDNNVDNKNIIVDNKDQKNLNEDNDIELKKVIVKGIKKYLEKKLKTLPKNLGKINEEKKVLLTLVRALDDEQILMGEKAEEFNNEINDADNLRPAVTRLIRIGFILMVPFTLFISLCFEYIKNMILHTENMRICGYLGDCTNNLISTLETAYTQKIPMQDSQNNQIISS